MSAKTKSEARALGESLFFTGRKCKRGHIDFRRATNSNCLSCEKIININHYQASPEKHKERSRLWRERNPDKLANQSLRKTERIRSDQSLRNKINEGRRAAYHNNEQTRNKILLRNRAYLDANKHDISKKTKAKRLADPESFRIKDRDRYEKNKKTINEKNKRWAAKNKKFVISYKKEWAANNPEKIKAARWRRKALIKKAEGAFSESDILRLRDLQRDLCACCKKSISDYYEIDHIMPLSLGGSNWPENLQLLCRPCNRSKWAKDPIQWANENGRLL